MDLNNELAEHTLLSLPDSGPGAMIGVYKEVKESIFEVVQFSQWENKTLLKHAWD